MLTPREVGTSEGDACLARAERHGDFDSKAAGACMVDHLKEWDRSSSELLVQFAKLRGHVPHDDRAFGPIIAKLVRDRLIHQVGECKRSRGNGTSGGRVYALSSSEK